MASRSQANVEKPVFRKLTIETPVEDTLRIALRKVNRVRCESSSVLEISADKKSA